MFMLRTMKFSPVLSSLLLVVAGVSAQEGTADLSCPDGGSTVSNFNLVSGDACILCVDTPSSCGVKCSCPTTECLTYSCQLTPDGCGDVICSGTGVAEPEAPECSAFDNCLDCLNQEGCGHWSAGQCMNDCLIMDVSCYSQDFINGTPEAICMQADNDAADGALCAAQGDCTSCVESILSDGESTCQWFGDYCSAGCGMEGCGVTSCDEAPPGTPTVLPECSAFDNCLDCLNQEGCGHWSSGMCMSDCLIMDVSCYSQDFINGTPEAICMQADNDAADGALCAAQGDCTSCVESILSDGESTCQWFGDYCSAGCGMEGCGVTSCDEAPPGTPTVLPECSAFDNCLDCLNQEGCGHWSSGMCMSDCLIMDVSCYSQDFINGTPEAICMQADNDAADGALCAAQGDCTSCVESILSDGESTCQWFGDYCSAGCGMEGCGVTSCDEAPPGTPTVLPECSAFDNCLDCLNQEGCGHWSSGMCMSDCLIMDVSCYSQDFINGTPEAICMQADNDAADGALCAAQGDCTSCVESILSDGESTCQWFGDYCFYECNMEGCGVTSCDEAPPGTPTLLPECDACAADDGSCKDIGESWVVVTDGPDCSKCTCQTANGDIACLGPVNCLELPSTLPEELENTKLEQEGTDCNGIDVEVACVLKDDETIPCEEYAPTSSEECTPQIKYTYFVRQEAPPTDVILTSIIRTRNGSPSGDTREFATNRWGENLTPTSMGYYEMNSWESEGHNFCARMVFPPTVFEVVTSACTTTFTYNLIAAPFDAAIEALPSVLSAEDVESAIGDTTDTLETGVDDATSSAAIFGAVARFFSAFIMYGMAMMWY